jgi:hypothetical protein
LIEITCILDGRLAVINSSSYYANLIAEISVDVQEAGDLLLQPKSRVNQYQAAEAILSKAASSARTGLESVLQNQKYLGDRSAMKYRRAFRKLQEAIAGWIPGLERNGVNCTDLREILPQDLLPPTPEV